MRCVKCGAEFSGDDGNVCERCWPRPAGEDSEELITTDVTDRAADVALKLRAQQLRYPVIVVEYAGQRDWAADVQVREVATTCNLRCNRFVTEMVRQGGWRHSLWFDGEEPDLARFRFLLPGAVVKSGIQLSWRSSDETGD
jgi:hypothetical protein